MSSLPATHRLSGMRCVFMIAASMLAWAAYPLRRVSHAVFLLWSCDTAHESISLRKYAVPLARRLGVARGLRRLCVVAS
jgi:hypothetical protein